MSTEMTAQCKFDTTESSDVNIIWENMSGFTLTSVFDPGRKLNIYFQTPDSDRFLEVLKCGEKNPQTFN